MIAGRAFLGQTRGDLRGKSVQSGGHGEREGLSKIVALQVHEWSGVFKNVVMAAHFRRFRPGLRVAVSLFGGHYWRTQVPTCPPLLLGCPPFPARQSAVAAAIMTGL